MCLLAKNKCRRWSGRNNVYENRMLVSSLWPVRSSIIVCALKQRAALAAMTESYTSYSCCVLRDWTIEAILSVFHSSEISLGRCLVARNKARHATDIQPSNILYLLTKIIIKYQSKKMVENFIFIFFFFVNFIIEFMFV